MQILGLHPRPSESESPVMGWDILPCILVILIYADVQKSLMLKVHQEK